MVEREKDMGVPPSGSGHSPKGGAAKASPAKPSVPNAALVGFFRGEGAAFGHKGDYEMWSPEETAVYYLREHLNWTHSVDERPVPMVLTCPSCGGRHIDEGEFATKRHHTHACQYCGMVWRPAIVATVGVQFLPGFKNPPAASETGDAK